jgi:hypothetical protein
LSTRLSTDGMAKAERLLGNLENVNSHTRLYDPVYMEKVIASIDGDMSLPDQNVATTITAKLISCYRMSGLQGGPINHSDFKQYTLRIFETYRMFPASIGWQSVEPSTGIPSKKSYWPKPFDVVEFCETVLAKRRTAKVMAQRHIAESKRRAAEREGDIAPLTADQKQRMAERWQQAKAEMLMAVLKVDMRA